MTYVVILKKCTNGQERRQKVAGYQTIRDHMTYEHENEHVGIENPHLPRLGLFLMQCVVLRCRVIKPNILAKLIVLSDNLMKRLCQGHAV